MQFVVRSFHDDWRNVYTSVRFRFAFLRVNRTATLSIFGNGTVTTCWLLDCPTEARYLFLSISQRRQQFSGEVPLEIESASLAEFNSLQDCDIHRGFAN